MSRTRIGVGRLRYGHDDNSGRRRSTLALVAGIAVLVQGVLCASLARAGTYVLRSCSVPGYPDAPLGPWRADGRPNVPAVDDCANGGGLSFSFTGTHELSPGLGPGIEIALPYSGPQSEIKLVKASMWYAARLAGPGQELSIVANRDLSNDTHPPWVVTGSPGAENLSFEQDLSPTRIRRYTVSMNCGPPLGPFAPEPCVSDHAIPFVIRGMELTLNEDIPPTVVTPYGTILAGGPQSGVRNLSYAASDAQSGLAKVEVLLGDTVVKSHDLTPRCFYVDLTVCPASDDGTLEVDTRGVPNGSYALAVRVRDAAGNVRLVPGDRAVDVANTLPAERVLPYAIDAKFKDSSRATLTVPYGRRTSIRGRLLQGSHPVGAGRPIEVLERADRRGAHEKRTRTVMTKADGSFSIGIATSRPSRLVRLAYHPHNANRTVSRALRLRVRAASRVRATLRGRLVRFSGRVLSGPLPRGGKRVQMEGRSPGSAWTTFKRLRTDKSGRFSGLYRLRVRRPGVMLKIRAVVPSERGYGFITARSRDVTLRVR